eukprot:CAMPEP_0197924096 /NCGR_PEP_ID=MMETSP1439-20131203/95080_1 /TAXON_ID=66791 /ORGANISM="Gonyaulax spinifera, Strain CCMP409" /LENGTH=396 /DNA_ID=CAMNT_0043546497 /DNA_START=31 /DNA_END=1221 /DNA_ORIENTATION=-
MDLVRRRHRHADKDIDPDIGKSTLAFIVGQGYPIERHNVVTKDGYILGMFRIPYGRNESKAPTARRPPVLLQHGLLDASTSFVCNSAEQSLAFILADAGWDVWLGNNRGGTYSRQHVWLGIESTEFWDFTWDQMAQYDFPAQIDYVLDHSGAKRLAYIGHSEGNMQAFAGLSRSESLASKISILVALAPVAFVKNQRVALISILRDLGVARLVDILDHELGHEFVDVELNNLKKLIPNVCEKDSVLQAVGACTSIVTSIFGSSDHLNSTRLPVFFSFAPASTSTKNIAHFAQMTRTGRFAMYDYMSKSLNKKHYNSTESPDYSLSNISVPVALFSGASDAMADPLDVKHMKSLLPASKVVKEVEIPGYSHLDFIWGEDANVLLYPQVLQVISDYAE